MPQGKCARKLYVDCFIVLYKIDLSRFVKLILLYIKMSLQKDVDPQGFLLNDNDSGVDHLGDATFADAIADSIHTVKTPITIGLFARWGSGKSFLLRHVECLLRRYQKQGEVDYQNEIETGNEERKAHPSKSNHSSSKIIFWSGITLLISLLLCMTLLLAIFPSLFLFNKEASKTLTIYKFHVNTSTTTTTIVQQNQEQNVVQTTLRTVGLILLPIEIVVIFSLCCCGKTWLSCDYYRNFSMIWYGAFTKLPILSPKSDIMQDPGARPAEVLKHVKRDAHLARAALESSELKRKYIFVDFKAWEYAGSDNLWAAIVTKLSDAVEEEFGSVATRLFRMLSVESVPTAILERKERTIRVQFNDRAEDSDVLDLMKQYGVVTSYKQEPNSEFWKVSYSSDGEVRNAMKSLKIEGIGRELCLANASTNNSSFQNARSTNQRQSSRPLIDDAQHGIELQQFNDGTETSSENSTISSYNPPSRFCYQLSRYPVKILCLPRLIWWIIISICCILLPLTVHVIANELQLDVFRTFRAIPMALQVTLWLPGAFSVTFVFLRFVWAMCNSQRKRINNALDGTKSKMADELGFMDKVKTEVQAITKLIRCARFTHQRDYKVFITIDDLDRVSLDKVRSVLEAVHILLSDRSSPFICILAVDPRIVVRSIEEGTHAVLTKANVSGQEYLKKIINLPICLPEIGHNVKKRFIGGLVDQADHTRLYRARQLREQQSISHSVPDSSNENTEEATATTNDNLERKSHDMTDGSNTVTDSSTMVMPNIKTDIPPPDRHSTSSSSPSVEEEDRLEDSSRHIEHEDFLFACRQSIYEDEDLHRHMEGNPRNIKRIFNVISLVANIVNSMVEKQKRRKFIEEVGSETSQGYYHYKKPKHIVRDKNLAYDLVRWVILTDQWPYRTSYILQVIEDSEQRVKAGLVSEKLPDNWTIFEIFQNRVAGQIQKRSKLNTSENVLQLDGDPDLFYSYLKLLRSRAFTKEKLVDFEKYAINLDYSIRHSIAFDIDQEWATYCPRAGSGS